MTSDEPCLCYMRDDRFPCKASQHEDLAAMLIAVKRAARGHAARRADEARDPEDEDDCRWDGDACDSDLDRTSDVVVGRTLSGEEVEAFTNAFRDAYTAAMKRRLEDLANRYSMAKRAYWDEMDKRKGETLAATKEEVAAREAADAAETELLAEARMKRYADSREDGPILLPDLRLGRAEKLMVEEALARAGSMRLAAQLLDISPARLRSAIRRHQIAWPRPAS